MADFAVVRRKRIKKVVGAVVIIAIVLLLLLSIVAMLGRSSGAFTVSLQQGTKSLGLIDAISSTDYKTYMTAGTLPAFEEYSYPFFEEYYGTLEEMDSVLDNDLSNESFVYTETPIGTIKYFKTTFYVVNCGSEECDYTLNLFMKNTTKSPNGLDAVLRVAFYENRNLEEHNHTFYAKKAAEPDIREEEGQVISRDYRELLYDNSTEYCESFESSTSLLTSEIKAFQPNELVRYTFLFWLEGTDPECKGKAPDSRLRLGVSVSVND